MKKSDQEAQPDKTMNKTPQTKGVIKSKPHSAEALWGLCSRLWMIECPALFQDDFDINHPVLTVEKNETHLILLAKAKWFAKHSPAKRNLNDRPAFIVDGKKPARDIGLLTEILVVIGDVVNFYWSYPQQISHFRNFWWKRGICHKSPCCSLGTIVRLSSGSINKLSD